MIGALRWICCSLPCVRHHRGWWTWWRCPGLLRPLGTYYPSDWPLDQLSRSHSKELQTSAALARPLKAADLTALLSANNTHTHTLSLRSVSQLTFKIMWILAFIPVQHLTPLPTTAYCMSFLLALQLRDEWKLLSVIIDSMSQMLDRV